VGSIGQVGDRRRAAVLGGGNVASTHIVMGDAKRRYAISPGKMGMLDAVVRIVRALDKYWPLSDRSIHYEVLNEPPLRHLSKPNSRYVNNRACYQDLTDLLTRARLNGVIPFEAIEDPTRKIVTWTGYDDVVSFARVELEIFLTGFRRDRQRGQPYHLEIVGEKNTVESSIKDVARHYGIPYTLGRGYCSLDPRKKMLARFQASRKGKLALLVLSDFDPDGDGIATSFAESMRDDFGVPMEEMRPVKVCLHWDQVRERNLAQEFDIAPEKMKQAKFQAHLAKYGNHFHELEALSHDDRADMLREAIHEVLDGDVFNTVWQEEKQQQVVIEQARKQIEPIVLRTLKRLGLS
jgi:hypothetical protein